MNEQNFTPFYSYGEVSDYWVDPRDGKEYNNNPIAPLFDYRRIVIDVN